MKKITSVLTLVFAVSILIAGCANTVLDPVKAANEELTAAGEEGRLVRVNNSQEVKINNASISGSLYNIAGAEFDLTFTGDGSFTLDKEALQEAITISSLTALPALPAGADATSVTNNRSYSVGSAVTAEVLYVSGPIARIKADLSALTYDKIEIRVDATKFTANGGRAKLNADEDDAAGEPLEDDLYVYPTSSISAITVASVTPPLLSPGGYPRNPRDSIQLVTSGPGLGLATSLDTTASESRLYNQFRFRISDWADTEDATIKTFFKANLKIDRYVDGDWVLGALAVSDVIWSENYTKYNTDRTYIASFAPASDRDILRVRLENFRDFTTGNVYSGFKQKLEWNGNKGYDNKKPQILVLVGPVVTLDQGVTVNGVSPIYTTGNINTGNATLVLAGSRVVYVKIPLNNGSMDARDPANPPIVGTGVLNGVTSDTVKIVAEGTSTSRRNTWNYETSEPGYEPDDTVTTYVNIKWEGDPSYEYTVKSVTNADGAATSTRVPSALLLKLPDTFERLNNRSWAVYITPGVKTSSGKVVKPDTTPYFLPDIYSGVAYKVTGTGNL
jgi:hypothetical protein